MPDNADFPDIKDSTALTDADLAGLKDKADWASTFGRGETNLAMRNKHAADVQDYNAALQQQHAQQLQQKLATDKDALAFWKATKELQQKEAFHQDMMANAARNFQRQQAKDLADQQAKKLVDDLKFQHADIANKHLTGFTTAMQQGLMGGVAPATKEYQNLALNSLLANPLADKEVVKHVFEVAKIKMDPEEVIAQWNAIPPEQRTNTTFFSNPDGTIKFVARNTTAAEQARMDISAINAGTAAEREARLKTKYEEDRKLMGLPPSPPPSESTPSNPTAPVKKKWKLVDGKLEQVE